MGEDTEKEYKFKKQLKELAKFKGSGTQLISVYIPVDYPIHETTNKLRNELSQASNIKSKNTRLNVSAALEKIINHLKMYKKTPPKGLCVFAGDVADNPSKTDVQLYSFEPIFELKMNIYRCDSKFFLEPLQNMMETKDSYGIVAMDGKDATIAIIKGTETRIIKKLHSTAHSKIRKGGQSAARYQRLIEESIEKYYKRIGEAMDKAFLNRDLKGVIVGGPGPAKDYFMKSNTYNYQLKVLGVVDAGYTDEYGIREVIAKSGNIIEKQEMVKEKILIERFIKEVVKGGLATYGLEEVKNAIETKQADHVLISEDIPLKRVKYKCSECDKEENVFLKENETVASKTCDKCSLNMQIEEEEPATDYFIELAQEQKIKVDVVSSGSAEGAQFLQGFGGIGAFLRYK